MLKLAYSTILLQEVPGEISLGLVFSGCPIGCPDCHSKEYWPEESGTKFDLDTLINQYKGMITCVCFMGGDWDEKHLMDMMYLIKMSGLKVCLYSGNTEFNFFNGIGMYLDYLKTGPYIKELGGIQSKTTNQRFYKAGNSGWIDITSTFEVK